MPNLPEPPQPGHATPPEPAVPLQADAAFDAWLRLELGKLHDDVLAEPVPEALLRVLRSPPLR